MKIMNASNVVLQPLARLEATKTLQEGQPIKLSSDLPKFDLTRFLNDTPDFARQVQLGRGAIGAVTFNKEAKKKLNMLGIGVGGGAGTTIGLGVGAVIDALCEVHPQSKLLLIAGCALIGGGTGAAVGSGFFSVDIHANKEGEFGITVSPAGSEK